MTKFHEHTQKSRRRFLKLLGSAGASAAMVRAAPLVGGLMATRQARAQGGAVKRAVFVYTPDGAPRGLWLPDGSRLRAATMAYEGLQSVCAFREVEVVASGHGNARKCLGELRWNSDWTSDTFDQQIATVLGGSTPFTSYVLGVQTNSSSDAVSRRAGSAVPAQDNPAEAYSQLFGGAPPVGEASDFLAQRRRVMDVNRAALAELGGRLGGFEQRLLDEHGAALSELEDRLIASTMGTPAEGCSEPAWNAGGYATNGSTDVPFLHTAELQSDVAVAAMKCGITNVLTLQLGWHQAVWYAHDTDYRGDHHGSCHSAPAEDNAEMTNYLSRCVAYLIRRLMEEDDPAVPGTKMIDNTVVVQVTDMGDGQDHSGAAGPNLIATRMPGFRVGQASSGGTNLQVLETVAEGMGLGSYVGTNRDAHAIWPCAGGSVIDALLA
ncbi:MAG: DUF1552 domain-containing protein [Myxococcota bacterium]